MKYKVGRRVDYTAARYFSKPYSGTSVIISILTTPSEYLLENGFLVTEEEITCAPSPPRSGKLLW